MAEPTALKEEDVGKHFSAQTVLEAFTREGLYLYGTRCGKPGALRSNQPLVGEGALRLVSRVSCSLPSVLRFAVFEPEILTY